LSIEIWDTGIGVPTGELHAIFEEYHQLDNDAREPSLGLGLGLSIVQRLGDLLGHQVRVCSQPGKGSVFAVDIVLPANGTAPRREPQRPSAEKAKDDDVHNKGRILVVEDDPDMRELLQNLLHDEGHEVATAADGIAALDLVTQREINPELILTDYNLPKGMNGLELAAALRAKFHREIPVVILTGDISTSTLRDIAFRDCVQLNKPVKLLELTQAVQRLLPQSAARSGAPYSVDAAHNSEPPVIFIVDDDAIVRESIRAVLEEDGRIVEDYATCEAFLESYRPGREACLLVDAHLPAMNGLELLQRLHTIGARLPAIMITGDGDVPLAVQAMKAGASDFIEKPISRNELLASVEHAFELSRDATKLSAWHDEAANRVAGLTPRQRQIMALVLAGHPNKNIAADLEISQRTVENHRASIMRRTGSRSLPALARLALAAAGRDAD
jgi:two-component system CheB/CheR fusion protein